MAWEGYWMSRCDEFRAYQYNLHRFLHELYEISRIIFNSRAYLVTSPGSHFHSVALRYLLVLPVIKPDTSHGG